VFRWKTRPLRLTRCRQTQLTCNVDAVSISDDSFGESKMLPGPANTPAITDLGIVQFTDSLGSNICRDSYRLSRSAFAVLVENHQIFCSGCIYGLKLF